MKPGKKDKKLIPYFDYKKCMRCFCCHEICPEKAIKLEKPFLMKMSTIVKKILGLEPKKDN